MRKDRFGRTVYKVGLHIHTTDSDGARSPEEAAAIYRAAGYDAIALTDHWRFRAGGTLAGLTVLAGCEYNVGDHDLDQGVMHILGIGMKTAPALTYGVETAAEIVGAIRAAGGIAVLAHPHWSLNTPEEAIAIQGFTATEIYNAVSDAQHNFRPYSGYFADAAASRGRRYPLLATDDTHYYDGSDECHAYILITAPIKEPDDVLRAVENGDFYASEGPELCVTREADGTFTVDCSPADEIVFATSASWARGRHLRGDGITHAAYAPCPDDHWLRVEIREHGSARHAWSNYFEI